MNLRTRIPWIIFALCAVLVLEGLGWVTWRAVVSERHEAEARADAAFQKSVSVALWRMESRLNAILARESARPYFEYLAYYAPGRAYTRRWREFEPGELLVASPLLQSSGRFVRLHYQVGAAGDVTSPQVPVGSVRQVAEAGDVPPEFVVLHARELAELEAILDLETLRDKARAGLESSSLDARQRLAAAEPADATELPARQSAAATAKQFDPNINRAAPRQNLVIGEEQVLQDELGLQARSRDRGPPPPIAAPDDLGPDDVAVSVFDGVWRNNPATGARELFLERVVTINSESLRQGAWIDRAELEADLLDSVRDLLPGARLTPTDHTHSEGEILASMPLRLVPGPMPPPVAGLHTATLVTLLATWLAVIGALIAIGLVLRTATALSRRRGEFVSAVTHELRTPLTTFCLYAEMLADGVVRDEDHRRRYLATLRDESRRLAAIVENVLAYARLGSSRRRDRAEPTRVDDLLDRITPTLADAATRAGMSLQVDRTSVNGALLSADQTTVERILLNLVDNACKYAAAADDRRIELAVRSDESSVEIRVTDHGPGIPPDERDRLFQPFHRGRGDAEKATRGLGLGLSLARGLARELGGDLDLSTPPGGGAAARLVLPLARPSR